MQIGNCKIKNNLILDLLKLQRYTRNGLTSTDVDIILYIARYQNSLGECKAFHSKVCQELKVSKQTFYNAIYNLANLNIISAIQSNDGWWSLRLNGNAFKSTNDYKCGYTNINKKLFTNSFSKLKVNEKLLCLYLMTNPRTSKEQPVSISLERLCQLMQVKEYTVRKYLRKLSAYFKIKIKNTVVHIKATGAILMTTFVSERVQFLRHYFSCNLSKAKVTYTSTELSDLCVLAIQYGKRGLSRIIHDVQYTLDKFGYINPRYLNTLLQRI